MIHAYLLPFEPFFCRSATFSATETSCSTLIKAIVSRRRKDGTLGHTAQIRLKKGGKVIHTESKTFDRKLAVQAWLKKRETELAEPGALTKPTDPLLKEMIDQYNLEKQQEHGKTKTKAQVLNTIKGGEDRRTALLRNQQPRTRGVLRDYSRAAVNA